MTDLKRTSIYEYRNSFEEVVRAASSMPFLRTYTLLSQRNIEILQSKRVTNGVLSIFPCILSTSYNNQGRLRRIVRLFLGILSKTQLRLKLSFKPKLRYIFHETRVSGPNLA